MNLKDKVIVITGASDGIGKEIALRLGLENCKLALISRDLWKLNAVKKEALTHWANEVKVYACDICKTDELEITINNIILDFGSVDILINNAGIWQKLLPLDQISKETIDDVIGTNLIALIHTTRLLLPTLRSRSEAAIINVSSKSGVTAQEGQSVYTASKYGVRGFTEVLKIDLKSTKIKVAWIYQSGTNTKMFEKAGENFTTEEFTNPTDLADIIGYILTRPDKIWLHDIYVEK
jgi:short-subunit dehydrogenase